MPNYRLSELKKKSVHLSGDGFSCSWASKFFERLLNPCYTTGGFRSTFERLRIFGLVATPGMIPIIFEWSWGVLCLHDRCIALIFPSMFLFLFYGLAKQGHVASVMWHLWHGISHVADCNHATVDTSQTIVKRLWGNWPSSYADTPLTRISSQRRRTPWSNEFNNNQPFFWGANVVFFCSFAPKKDAWSQAMNSSPSSNKILFISSLKHFEIPDIADG